MNKSTIGKALLYALLIAFALVQLFPLFWLGTFSLKDNAEIFGGNIAGLPQNWLWSNYQNAFFQGNVLTYFVNSVLVTGSTILLVLLLSSMTAYAVTRMQWKLSKLVRTIIMLGMMVPLHASLLPLFMVLKNLKLLNSYAALVLPYTAFGLPMAVLIFSGFLSGIPRELEESAAIDGCSIYRIFLSIILPLIRPAVATVAIFTFISAWNELMFAVTFINTKGLKTLTVGILSMVGGYVTKWGPIGAGLMIATLPTILIYVLLSDQVQKSLIAGSIKG